MNNMKNTAIIKFYEGFICFTNIYTKYVSSYQQEGTIFDRVEVTEPPDLSKLETMRSVRQKELRMAAISRELLFYFVFTIVVFLIGYNMRDEMAFHQTNDIKELLKLSTRKSVSTSNKLTSHSTYTFANRRWIHLCSYDSKLLFKIN